MTEALADLRYAVRSLRRSPTFPVASLLTIAIGVGAATTIYSVADTILLRLPYPDSDRLVRVVQNFPHMVSGRPPLQRGLTLDEVENWRIRTMTSSPPNILAA